MARFPDKPADYSPLSGIEGDPNIKEIVGTGGSFRINLQGARIERMSLNLGSESRKLTLLGQAQRQDGTLAFTHPCLPNFGPDTANLDLPQHGPARNDRWTLVEEGDNKLVISYEVRDTGQYLNGLKATQAFSLKDGVFELITTLANEGQEALPANFGEHFYWPVIYRQKSGWKGLSINGVNVTEQVKQNSVIKLQDKNIIQFPHLEGREVILEQEGLLYAVLWTDGSTHWVCIEPAEGDPKEGFFGSPESLIPPGQSRETKIRISLGPAKTA